jgi:hypothetical protein
VEPAFAATGVDVCRFAPTTTWQDAPPGSHRAHAKPPPRMTLAWGSAMRSAVVVSAEPTRAVPVTTGWASTTSTPSKSNAVVSATPDPTSFRAVTASLP